MKSRSNKQRQLAKARKRHENRRRCRLETLESRELLAGDLFVEGSVVVQFDGDATPAERQAAIDSIGGTLVRNFDFINGALISVPDSSNEAALAGSLQGLPQVDYAGLDYFVQPELVPNDPLFDLQWGMNNTGQNPLNGTPDADIDAPEAWDIFTGTDEVVIAVIDTGVDYTHEDLAENMWRNPFEIPDGIDNDNNGFIDDMFGADFIGMTGNPLDLDGHGTHVAGIAAAAGNNNIGVTGVHWNAKIMALRAIGGPSTGIYDALDYMIDMKSRGVNIVVSNNSWGSAPGSPFDPLMFAAIDASIDAGVPFVASAGNDTNDNDVLPHFPSDYDLDGIISVAATDKFDELASFSNFGPFNVDLAAPGQEIVSTVPIAYSLANPAPYPEGYDAFQGTSMAAPHVAGAVALAADLNPSLSVLGLKSLILSSVDVIPDLIDDVGSGGRLNVGRMLDDLPSGEIRGTVYEDSNGDGAQQFAELGLGGFTVFTDLNEDGARQATEPMTTTEFDGTYVLKHYLGAGSYNVMQVLPPGFVYTVPSDGIRRVTFGGFSDVITGVDFGNRQKEVSVSGTVREDNGDPTVTNPGVEGIRVYADLNHNGRSDLGEPSTHTSSLGEYVLEVPGAGDYDVRIDLPPGWSILDPVDGVHEVTVSLDTSVVGLDFLLDGQLFDYGGAPAPYPEAYAGLMEELFLGTSVIGEATFAAADESDVNGVFLTAALSSGAAVGATVTVENNDNILPRGYFNGWVDFNQDKEWTDDEQVYKNVRLGQGTHDLPAFTVPTTALTGTTHARYVYAWEYDARPDQAFLAGEIEDVLVSVFGTDPVAVDDRESVEQDSTHADAENRFFPLANDFVSAGGGALEILTADTSSVRGGEIIVSGDRLSLTYMPEPGFFSTDSFEYTIIDGSGATDTGVITVDVAPSFDGPLALDDNISRLANPVGVPPTTTNIRVLDNDVPAPGAGVVTTLSQITVQPDNGVASIFNNGTPGNPTDDVVSYTPVVGFNGTDQLEYLLIDSLGRTSRATVTINVGDTTDDDIVRYSVTFTDPLGNPITEVAEGQPFLGNVFVEDLRPDPVFPPLPADQVDRRGVFAAYLDVLYDRDQLTVVGGLDETAGGYQVLFGGSTAVSGIIDEAGGFASGVDPEDPPGADNRILVFSIPLRANPGTAGQLATLVPDPANLLGIDETDDIDEVSGQHDTLIYEPSDDVEVNEMRFDIASIPITGGVPAEGEAHNRFTPTDVNGDRITNIFDLHSALASLLVLGTGPVAGEAEPQGAEGEAGSRRRLMTDVNNDGYRTQEDLQRVFAKIFARSQTPQAIPAEGEPEAVFEPVTTVDAPVVDFGDAAGGDALAVDILLADDDERADRRASLHASTALAELDEEFYADISDIWGS